MPQIDLSLAGLFLQASGTVQVVLLLLLACSMVSWAIIIDKLVTVLRLRRDASHFEQTVREGRGDLPQGLGRVIAEAGLAEKTAGQSIASSEHRQQRLEDAMRDSLVEALGQAERRLSYLATIGSTAPFIGLFGTVWGIMHSFAGIAQANETSMAVVAPGIAEALSTTAIGLAAAIPASIAYNKFSADFAGLFRRFSLAIGRLARRSLEEAA